MRSLPALCLLAACSSPATTPELTWYADVEPLAFRHCVACHHDGGVGPGDWTDPAQVEVWAAAIGAAVESERMPPPTADPACRDYEGSERTFLPAESRELIVAWAEQGGALGDPEDRDPSLEVPVLALEGADLALDPHEAHPLDLDAGGNEYHCVVLDNPLDEALYITGFDVALDEPKFVHHMLLAIDRRGDAGIEYGTDGTARSFRCQDQVVESDWDILHAWTPGMEPVVFPDGYGMLLEPGDQLVLQYHYFGDPQAGPVSDGSGYRLRTADAVTREVTMEPFGPSNFRIPAGDISFSAEDYTTNPVPIPIDVLGAFPHMHLLGEGFKAWLEHEDGTQTCLLDGRYDFQNQRTYVFTEPARLFPGEEAWMRCTWDNSSNNAEQLYDPPQEIGYGEGSNQEMCFLLTYVAPGF
jgi:hypothetical protein